MQEGAQSVSVGVVPAGGSTSVTLRLLPLAAGEQRVGDLMLSGEQDGRVYDTLQPLGLFVMQPGGGGRG